MTFAVETENFEPSREWMCAECGGGGQLGERVECQCAINVEEQLHA